MCVDIPEGINRLLEVGRESDGNTTPGRTLNPPHDVEARLGAKDRRVPTTTRLRGGRNNRTLRSSSASANTNVVRLPTKACRTINSPISPLCGRRTSGPCIARRARVWRSAAVARSRHDAEGHSALHRRSSPAAAEQQSRASSSTSRVTGHVIPTGAAISCRSTPGVTTLFATALWSEHFNNALKQLGTERLVVFLDTCHAYSGTPGAKDAEFERFDPRGLAEGTADKVLSSSPRAWRGSVVRGGREGYLHSLPPGTARM